jgi:hypothetical protein
MSGLNSFANTGLDGSVRSTIAMPLLVPARYAYWHCDAGPGMHDAVCPTPGGTTESAPNSLCAKSMNPFGVAEASFGDDGFEMSMT